jgi:hypothetical protein
VRVCRLWMRAAQRRGSGRLSMRFWTAPARRLQHRISRQLSARPAARCAGAHRWHRTGERAAADEGTKLAHRHQHALAWQHGGGTAARIGSRPGPRGPRAAAQASVLAAQAGSRAGAQLTPRQAIAPSWPHAHRWLGWGPGRGAAAAGPAQCPDPPTDASGASAGGGGGGAHVKRGTLMSVGCGTAAATPPGLNSHAGGSGLAAACLSWQRTVSDVAWRRQRGQRQPCSRELSAPSGGPGGGKRLQPPPPTPLAARRPRTGRPAQTRAGLWPGRHLAAAHSLDGRRRVARGRQTRVGGGCGRLPRVGLKARWARGQPQTEHQAGWRLVGAAAAACAAGLRRSAASPFSPACAAACSAAEVSRASAAPSSPSAS